MIKEAWVGPFKNEYCTYLFSKHSAIPGIFFFIFAFLIHLTFNKNCRGLDSNRGSVVSAATAVPTVPQPLHSYLSVPSRLVVDPVLAGKRGRPFRCRRTRPAQTSSIGGRTEAERIRSSSCLRIQKIILKVCSDLRKLLRKTQ